MPFATLDKASLRRSLLADRQTISPKVRQQWDTLIGARVLAWWSANPVQSLGVYWPIRGEPDLRQVYDTLTARGVQLALPMVMRPDAALTFAAWKPGQAMAADRFGVMIPQDTSAVLQPDALLIPCVGFNGSNIRLGYGGGFYDRTLAARPRPLTIGIAYACCRTEFNGDTHDIALDMVITERFSPDNT